MISILKKNKKHLVYIPLILYWLVLFIATSIPAQSMPEVGISDKFNHLFAYMILSMFLYLTFIVQSRYSILKNNPALFSISIATVYGIFDEVHQMLIPGRSAEFLDWVADVSGAIIGAILISLLVNWLVEKEKKNNI